MNRTEFIRSTQTGFVTTLVKAAVITILVIGAIASMSSCTRIAGQEPFNTKWRGKVLKTNRTIFVENVDSLPVMMGDTVTVFFTEIDNKYYISNNPIGAADTSTLEMYVDNNDTIYSRFEAWNVVLERRVCK
jgi:hypothetical protein